MHSSGPWRAGRLPHALAIGAFVASFVASMVVPVPVDGLPAWKGGIDLYRPGVFTAQKTLLWCTAADVQIIRNIVDHQADHSRTAQSRYFSWMRLHNRYAIPVSDGVDPAGWTAGLRHYVDDRYRLVQSTSFSAALRAAVTSLRRTNLPVGLLVAHGEHAWVLTGFTATADPAATSSFTVTSVRVVGPLYGIQSLNGYDMAPDTKLTPSQLRRFWTPWRYARVRMAWEGRILAIEGASATMTLSGSGSASTATAPSGSGSSTSAATAPSGSGSVASGVASSSAAVVSGSGSAVSAPDSKAAPSTQTSPASETAVVVPGVVPGGVRGLVFGLAALGVLVVAVAVGVRSTAAGVSTRARPPTTRQRSG